MAREKDTFRRSTPFDPPFDPEGSGYDYESAIKAGLKPDDTGHWPSRDPKTGMILKGSGHLTWGKTLAGEDKAGNTIRRREDGRYYSFPKKTAMAPHPSRVKFLTGEIDTRAMRAKQEALRAEKDKLKKQAEGEAFEKERAEIIREIIDRQAKQAAPKESVVFGLNAVYLGDRTGNEGGQKLTDPKYKGYPLMNRLHQQESDKHTIRKALHDWRTKQNSDPNAWG